MEQQSNIDEPLLSGGRDSGNLSSYQYVGRIGSVIPTASFADTEISVDEIRSAAAVSDLYPPSLHAPLISSPEPYPGEHSIGYQGGYGADSQTINQGSSRPARTWKIHAVEDCNVYVGTYIVGLSREVYLKDYYPSRFCWGLCPCFHWLNL